jgi:hypothetical protein
MRGVYVRDAAPLMRRIDTAARRFAFAPHLTPFLHRHGVSPLHLAARGGYCAAVRLLMGTRAKVNVKDKRYNVHDEWRARA